MTNIPEEIYEICGSCALPDIHAEGISLRHKKSGARIALVPCADTNRVFYIAFRTPPLDSTGAAHIVEHTVLLGSEKYPLKDPFIALLKGSLNTYLNATTYPDKTMYPAASTNAQDFRNLMDVYLDAVFHPNFYHEENIFRQEGWSLRLPSADEPLTISGVVYNEMKGAFSSPDDILERKTLSLLYPDTPYGEESGGDPDHIPELTYEKFLAFHKKYYHPSNSYIYLYGDLDYGETLTYLDREYLSAYDREQIRSEIPLQAAFSGMKRAEVPYPVVEDEETEDGVYLSFSTVSGDALDMKASIAMDAIDYALFSMPGAPVREALLKEGIGTEVYGEYNDGIAQPYFSVVAKNAKREDAGRFYEVIRNTLEKILSEGIEKESLLAGLHTMEFSFRAADYGTYPKGLIYGLDLMDTWLYDDRSVFDAVKQLPVYEELSEEVRKGTGYFEDLVRERILNNQHALLLTMYPEMGMQEKKDLEEEARLAAMKAAMSEEEREELIRKTAQLSAYQEKPDTEEALLTLPRLRVSDLTREAKKLSTEELSVDCGKRSVPFLFHEADTTGIAYVSVLFDTGCVPEDELVYLGLLRSVLFNVDTEKYTYASLLNEINVRTGGISGGVTIYDLPGEKNIYQPFFILRGRTLYQELGFLFDIIGETLTTSSLSDEERIGEIIREAVSQKKMYLTNSGTNTASMEALSSLHPMFACQEALSGVTFYKKIRDLEKHFPENVSVIREHFAKLFQILFRPGSMKISYTGERKSLRDAMKSSQRLLAVLCDTYGFEPALRAMPLSARKGERKAYVSGGQVQHVVCAADLGFPDPREYGHLMVLKHILNYGFLWREIRDEGNAYGTGISFRRSGLSAMMSYRDPHLKRTLDVFRRAAAYVREFCADPEEMDEYIIGTISSMDTPYTPALFGSYSLQDYLQRQTQEMRQATRDAVLSVTAEDIRKLSDKLAAFEESDHYCVVGSETMIGKHKELFDAVEVLS